MPTCIQTTSFVRSWFCPTCRLAVNELYTSSLEAHETLENHSASIYNNCYLIFIWYIHYTSISLSILSWRQLGSNYLFAVCAPNGKWVRLLGWIVCLMCWTAMFLFSSACVTLVTWNELICFVIYPYLFEASTAHILRCINIVFVDLYHRKTRCGSKMKVSGYAIEGSHIGHQVSRLRLWLMTG